MYLNNIYLISNSNIVELNCKFIFSDELSAELESVWKESAAKVDKFL